MREARRARLSSPVPYPSARGRHDDPVFGTTTIAMFAFFLGYAIIMRSAPLRDYSIPELVEKMDAGFISRVKEYKELIAVIVFFIAGVLWIFAYFATKQ